MYETPGGTIYHAAHRAIEQMTLDRGAAHLKDELMPRYAELIYNGFWFSPEREMLQATVDHRQARVDGNGADEALQGRGAHHRAQVAAKPLQRESGDLRGRCRAYEQRDAEGFIELNALRLRLLGRRDRA